MFYDRTDKLLDALDEIVIDRFNKLKLRLDVKPDELLKLIKKLYQEMLDTAEETFALLADAVYADHYRRKRNIGKQIADEVLSGYDPVSKYVFSHEMERRAARLFEALMGSTTKVEEIDKAKRSMALAYHIYAVRVTDEAAVRAMIASGVKKVRWVAEDDTHTCKVCHKRDDKIYDIDNIPPKPHINCRCWLVRVP